WTTCAPGTIATPSPSARYGARGAGWPTWPSPPGRPPAANPSPPPAHTSRSTSPEACRRRRRAAPRLKSSAPIPICRDIAVVRPDPCFWREDDDECGNSKRDPGLPDRSEAAASPDDPFLVLQQGNLPARADLQRLRRRRQTALRGAGQAGTAGRRRGAEDPRQLRQ